MSVFNSDTNDMYGEHNHPHDNQLRADDDEYEGGMCGVRDGGSCGYGGMNGGTCERCGCTGDCDCAKGGFNGGTCGSMPGNYGGYVSGGSMMSTVRMLWSNDWMKALIIVFLVLLLFSLYHYGKNSMYMRKYRGASLRRRFPHFSSSLP